MASSIEDVQRCAAAVLFADPTTTKRTTPITDTTRAPPSCANSQRRHYFKQVFFSMIAAVLILVSCGNVLASSRRLLFTSTETRSETMHSRANTSIANGVNTAEHELSYSLRHGRSDLPAGMTENGNEATVARGSSAETAAGLTLEEKSATSPSFSSLWGVCDPRTVQTQYRPAGNRVWIISFAGWDDQRKQNLKQLERDLKNRTTNVRLETLFYTEKDLPQKYYDDFSWAFAKETYRGFWSWKPWILRNLTETEIFQPQDLVFWLDSDERIRPDSQYFETALCNMEHRNDNFGGIFPFARCFNHEEGSYTKPEVFERMGLNATIYGKGEQIYGGSLGFRVVKQETLSFLKEWEEWGRDPIMFGNDEDFGSSAALPKKYKQHKNDQSVFSLMVRSRNMTTWPAPYFWRGDSGVKQCLDNFKRAGYCFFFDNEQYDFEKICRPFESWLQELV